MANTTGMVIVDEFPFTILKERESGRLVRAVILEDGNTAECACCGSTIKDDYGPFIGVEFTYDANQFTALDRECSANMGIIQTNGEVTKTERKAPAKTAAAKKTASKKDDGGTTDMDLKAKLKAKNTAAAAPAATSTLALAEEEPSTNGGGGGLALAEENPAPFEGAKAETPADLKAKLKGIDAKPSAGGGLTKADVQEVVEAVVAEHLKSVTELFKRHRTDFQKDLEKALKPVTDAVASFKQTLVDALGASDETPAEAPKAATPKPAEKPKAAAPAATAQTPAPAATRPPFIEWVRQMMDEDGLDLEALGDTAVELQYFKQMPDNKQEFLDQLTGLLVTKGFKVENGTVYTATA